MLRVQRTWGAPLAGLALVAGCSAFRATLDDGDLGYGAGGTSGPSGGSASLPPEVELEENFRAPVVAGNYLFTANPASNRVALIDGESLEIETLDAGHEPTYLAGLPETKQGSGAVVLNVRSHDASVYLLPREGGPADLITAKAKVHKTANTWSVSPRGSFAIAWTKSTPNALGSDGFQDITILEPSAEPVATTIGVGFRPSQIFISEDEKRAIVVSDPGLSVIELGRNGTSGVIAEYPLDEPAGGSREVVVTPDGKYALVRALTPSLLVVDLDSGKRTTLAMPGVLSDLDLSADGTLLAAVVRAEAPGQAGTGGGASWGGQGGTQQGGEQQTGPAEGGVDPGGAAGSGSVESPGNSLAVFLDLPGAIVDLTEPRVVSIADVVGSISLTQEGDAALLYTNATPNSRLWLLTAKSPSLRVVDLRSPVLAALPAPDGKHAAVILTPPAGSTKQGAFALVPVEHDLPPRIEGTPAPTAQVAFSPDGDAVIVTTRGTAGASNSAFLGGLPNLSVESIPLPSPPLAAGVIGPLHKGFVAQEHPEGRLTFIGLSDKSVTTLTGYELGSRVIE